MAMERQTSEYSVKPQAELNGGSIEALRDFSQCSSELRPTKLSKAITPGDGKNRHRDLETFDGEWFIVRSEDFSFYGFPFGTTGDVVAPGDYDGDGKFDVTVFRPSSATWFISRTTAGTQIVHSVRRATGRCELRYVP
jgi:hypothetical protein